jgi:sugar O-acyltransferase (sialic acid O-acetyltransferase NeuD family)
MEKVIIFGNGSVAKAAYYKITLDSPHEAIAFTVDPSHLKEQTLFDLPVVPFPDVASLFPPDAYRMMIAVGYVKQNRLKAERFEQAKAMGYQLLGHVSSAALVSPEVTIGENCMINAQSIVSPFVQIGANVTIGAGTIIGHDVVIKDHCFIGDGVAIAGGVTIEPYCFLGIGSIIRNKVTVARECVIGAGALILQDTKPKEVYMGRAADLLPIPSDQLSLG